MIMGDPFQAAKTDPNNVDDPDNNNDTFLLSDAKQPDGDDDGEPTSEVQIVVSSVASVARRDVGEPPEDGERSRETEEIQHVSRDSFVLGQLRSFESGTADLFADTDDADDDGHPLDDADREVTEIQARRDILTGNDGGGQICKSGSRG